MRILAVTSPRPVKAEPGIPTVAQAGFPGATNEGSYGLLAPAGTPKPIIERIVQATRTLLSSPDYQQLMTDAGFEATPESTRRISARSSPPTSRSGRRWSKRWG